MEWSRLSSQTASQWARMMGLPPTITQKELGRDHNEDYDTWD